MLRNTKMRFDLDYIFGVVIALLIILVTHLYGITATLKSDIKRLNQTVEQKFISPIMIFDKDKILPR